MGCLKNILRAVILALAFIGFLLMIFLFKFSEYSIEMSNNYSQPSVVLYGGRGDNRVTFDDYREAYRWLSHNTPEGSRIMSWWDYGYQISHLANRTVIVDNTIESSNSKRILSDQIFHCIPFSSLFLSSLYC